MTFNSTRPWVGILSLLAATIIGITRVFTFNDRIDGSWLVAVILCGAGVVALWRSQT